MTQSFKSQSDLDAYKAHVLDVATERFNALMNLGPVTQRMALTGYPEGPWSVPAAAAAAGGKLILTGSSGAGKTTVLKKVVWNLALRDWRPRGGYVPSILDRLKSGDIGSTVEWLNGGTVLVLDDLDKLRGTPYEVERILEAINKYDVHGLPVVASMNVELKAFRERAMSGGVPLDFADAIVSRLRGRSSSFFVSGPDHREPA